MLDTVSPTAVLDRKQVRLAFERAADTYDRSAVLQREIGKRLLERLDLVTCSPRMIVDVGCGTGYCTRALHSRYRRARVIGVDIAQSMLSAARKGASWFGRQRFVCGDAGHLPLADHIADMVVSNLTLQWCDTDSVLAEFTRVLRPGGLLMFTSFGPDTLRELRAAWRAVDDRMHVHDFVDLHDLGDAMVRAGLAEPVMDAEHFLLTYPDVETVLRELKALGAHNVSRARHRGLTGKRLFARFREAYAQQAQDGQIPASYEVVYGHAWAPTKPRSRLGGEGSAVIPLSRVTRQRR